MNPLLSEVSLSSYGKGRAFRTLEILSRFFHIVRILCIHLDYNNSNRIKRVLERIRRDHNEGAGWAIAAKECYLLIGEDRDVVALNI